NRGQSGLRGRNEKVLRCRAGCRERRRRRSHFEHAMSSIASGSAPLSARRLNHIGLQLNPVFEGQAVLGPILRSGANRLPLSYWRSVALEDLASPPCPGGALFPSRREIFAPVWVAGGLRRLDFSRVACWRAA